MTSDCQRHCREEIEKLIQNMVGGKMNGSLESIYFQEEADYKTNLNKDNSNEVLKHRFLLSFTAPCLRTQLKPAGSQPATCEADIASVNSSSDDGSSQSQDSLPQHVHSPALPPPNRTTAFYELPMNHYQDSEENGIHREHEDPYFPLDVELMMHDQMLIGRGQGEAVVVDLTAEGKEGMTDSNMEENFCSSEGIEYTELTQLTSISGMLFPLSNDDMHAVIDQQLSKNVPDDPKPMEWGNQLFNNLNSLSAEADKNKRSPQQQSAEVSSSSGTCVSTSPPYDSGTSPPTSPISTATATYTEVSGSQEYISNVNFPYTSLQQFGNGPMNIIIAGTEMLQQEGIAPAKLPAVSSLFSTGAYNNFSWSSTENRTTATGPIRPAIPMTKQVHRQTTTVSRQALLLPKPRSVSSIEHNQAAIPTSKSRSRKKSPLGRNKEPAEEPQSMFSDTSANAPQGHSYESWILEEGLHKVRKQGLHKTDENKDVYPYACPACNKKYKNPNGIKYHAKYAHGPKSIFLCDVCKREYSTRHGLAAHKRTHPQTFSPPRTQIGTTSDTSLGTKSNVLITSTIAKKSAVV